MCSHLLTSNYSSMILCSTMKGMHPVIKKLKTGGMSLILLQNIMPQQQNHTHTAVLLLLPLVLLPKLSQRQLRKVRVSAATSEKVNDKRDPFACTLGVTAKPSCETMFFAHRLGVIVEVNCETDFVARGDVFKQLANDMAMQIAACSQVTVVDSTQVPAAVVEKERSVQLGKEDILKKPEQIRWPENVHFHLLAARHVHIWVLPGYCSTA